MKNKGKNFELIEDASIEITRANKLMQILLNYELNKDESIELIDAIADSCYKASQNCCNYIQDPNNEDFSFDLILEVIDKTNKSPEEVWEFLKTKRINL